MNNRILVPVFALLLVFLFSGAALADVYLEQVSTSARNEDEETLTRMYISGSAIRIEEPNGKIVNITDFANQQLITLDTENKEYFTIPLQQIREDLSQGARHFRGAVTMSWRLEETGKTEMIAGYKATKRVFHGRGEARNTSQGGKDISITLEIWFGEEVPIPADINNQILNALGIEQNPFVDATVINEIKRMGGYPLRTITSINMGSVKDEIRQEVLLLTEVESDPSRYQVPAGYTQIDSK